MPRPKAPRLTYRRQGIGEDIVFDGKVQVATMRQTSRGWYFHVAHSAIEYGPMKREVAMEKIRKFHRER